MTYVEIVSWTLVAFISVAVVVTGFIRRWKEVNEEPEEAGSNVMRILAEERGKTIKLLMGQVKELGEDYRKAVSNFKAINEDFDKLQDLAMWMTGCGYDFTQHPYYMDMKFLITKGIEVDPKEETIRGDKYVEPTLAGPVKYYTDEEAHALLTENISCPECASLTCIGMTHTLRGWRRVEDRYCPLCEWKEKEVDPLLSGDEIYLKEAGPLKTTTITGWGQEDGRD